MPLPSRAVWLSPAAPSDSCAGGDVRQPCVAIRMSTHQEQSSRLKAGVFMATMHITSSYLHAVYETGATPRGEPTSSPLHVPDEPPSDELFFRNFAQVFRLFDPAIQRPAQALQHRLV